MRIGIYGGTFNPPHWGHLRGAEYAVKVLDLDRLVIIPSCQLPNKELPIDSPTPLQRLEMLRFCVPQSEKVIVSDMEIRRGGISYTHETVAELKKEYQNDALILLVGADMFLSFLDWKGASQMAKDVSLAVLYRGEKDEVAAVEEKKAEMERQGIRVYLVENPIIPISSTDIRRMLIFGCADSFLPAEIQNYIREKRLYGTAESRRNLSENELEKQVLSLLKPSRVNHVLGCRDTAVALAEKWGANSTDAARAALLHDVTKALSSQLQLTLCKAYGIILDNFSNKNPKTLHALTGSLVAERIFGENPAVVSAIRSHTTGKADMNMLEKIIYVADYMEPNRKFPGVEKLRELAYTDIDKALKLGLEMTLALLREQGSEISPESQQALAFLSAQKG